MWLLELPPVLRFGSPVVAMIVAAALGIWFNLEWYATLTIYLAVAIGVPLVWKLSQGIPQQK